VKSPGGKDQPIVFAETLRQAQAAADQALHQRVLVHCATALESADGATPDQLSELRFLRADSLRHLGRWSDAAEEFAVVAELAGTPSVESRACRAWRLLSEIARRSRRYDEAVTAAERSEALAEAMGDTFGLLFSRIPRARVLTDRGHNDDALALLNEVMAEAEQALAEQPVDRALVLVAARSVVSLILFRRHENAEALALLTGLRDQAELVPHAITLAAYHRQIAILHEVQRNYSAAIRHLNVALDLYDRVRFEPGRYDVYWSLSLSYTDMGDLRTARLCLEQCSAIAEALDMRLELGKSKSSFAELAVREGDYEAAILLFREDLEISRNLGDEQALGHCNRKIADCYRMMGNADRAAEHARASIAAFENTGREAEANGVRVLLSRILIEDGQIDQADAELATARDKMHGGARASDRAALLRTDALVHSARREWAAATGRFEESLALQDRSHPTRDLAGTHFEAGLACRDGGDFEAAKSHLRQSVDIAGILGSRDLWQQAVDALWELDIIEAQQLMLKPYLPGSAVEELRQGEAPGRLENATVMFVDMRGATALSGTLSPLMLSEVVSAFLGPVVRIILRWQGSVDKFIGDCVMAVFGLGDKGTSGAELATRAGIEIIEYMEATKEIRRRTGASVLEATIGINTGEVVAGCFGPLLRRDYTVLGYHVNLAQRLQSLAGAVEAELGTRMVISESTRAELPQAIPLDAIDLSVQKLKGIDTDDVQAWLLRAAEAIEAIET